MRIALIALSISLMSSAAFADDIKLNEKSIRDFYHASKTVLQKSFEEYSSFTDKHTSSDAIMVINDETVVGNQPPQPQSITMDRAKLMQSLNENYNIGKQTSLNYRILNIQISPDGKSAIVKNESDVTGIISTPDAGGKMKIDSKANCTDTLIIGPNSEIQTSKSTCDSKTKITPQS